MHSQEKPIQNQEQPLLQKTTYTHKTMCKTHQQKHKTFTTNTYSNPVEHTEPIPTCSNHQESSLLQKPIIFIILLFCMFFVLFVTNKTQVQKNIYYIGFFIDKHIGAKTYFEGLGECRTPPAAARGHVSRCRIRGRIPEMSRGLDLSWRGSKFEFQCLFCISDLGFALLSLIFVCFLIRFFIGFDRV